MGQRLLAIFFPSRCLMCRTVVPFGQHFCSKCCWYPADMALLAQTFQDADCNGALALFQYDTVTVRAIMSMKTYQDNGSVDFFSHEMSQRIEKEWATAGFDLVTCVPMSPKTRRSRGFNHAAVLGRAVADLLGLPFHEDLLSRDSRSKPQRRLLRDERFENANNSYYLAKGQEKANGMRILLIDDVLTTGATARACARLLKNASAASVYAAAVCAANPQQSQLQEESEAEEPETLEPEADTTDFL